MIIQAKSRASAQGAPAPAEPVQMRRVASWVETAVLMLAALWASTVPWGEAEAHGSSHPHAPKPPSHHGRDGTMAETQALAQDTSPSGDRTAEAPREHHATTDGAPAGQVALGHDGQGAQGAFARDALAKDHAPQGSTGLSAGFASLDLTHSAAQYLAGASSAAPEISTGSGPISAGNENTLSVLDLDAAGVIAAVDKLIAAAAGSAAGFHDLAVGDILNETVRSALQAGQDPILALHQLGPELAGAADRLLGDPQSHLSHLIDTLAPTEGHTTAEAVAALPPDPVPEPAHPILSDPPLFT